MVVATKIDKIKVLKIMCTCSIINLLQKFMHVDKYLKMIFINDGLMRDLAQGYNFFS